MFSVVRSTVAGFSRAKLALYTMVVMAFMAVVPAMALATESEAEKKAGEKITEATTKVADSGETYILLVLTGLVGIIALVIILPKAISFIKRFI